MHSFKHIFLVLPLSLGICIAPLTTDRVLAQTLTDQAAQQIEVKLSPYLKNLNLSDVQQDQVRTLTTTTLSQIEQVLTPDQQQQLQVRLREGMDLRSTAQDLNLTEEQRQRIEDILIGVRPQLQQILTPAQRQQLRRQFLEQGN